MTRSDRTATSGRRALSIRARLVAGYLTVIALFAAASSITVVSIVQLGRAFASDERLDHLKHRGHQLSIHAGDMYRQQERIIHGDGGSIDAYAAARDATRATATALVGIVPERLATLAGEVATLVDEMDTLFRERILPAVHTDRNTQATLLEHRSRAMVERVMHLTDQLIVELERESAAAGAAATTIVSRTIAVVLSCLVIAVAVAVVLGVRVTRSIDEPVRALQHGARSIASGDLSTRVDAQRSDELGELAESFNQMAADLGQQQDALVEARKLAAIGQLAAGFAHEINNPLGVIHGHLRLLQERIDHADVDTHERLGVIGSEVELCRRTVRELLDLARPLRSTRDVVALGALFDDVLERAKALPGFARIELSCEVEPSDLTVEGDPARLRQLMSNLVANAVQACQSGGRIRVAASRHDGRAVITVVDDGVGVASEDLPHIFEPFHTSKSDGTGIGLFLCEAIARAHGGTITATSVPGAGTTITVELRGTIASH